MHTPSSLSKLIEALRIFPGIGPKSAQRMAYHLLQNNQVGAIKLVQAIEKALATLVHCKSCHTLCETDLCEICSDTQRLQQLLCIVEMPMDMLRIEQTLAYEGLYFVLMGRISPLDGLGPNDIHIQQLLNRASDGIVNEVVIATNFTIEGEATAHYIAEMLRARGIAVSRIARGLPVGGELEHIDPGTLAQSFIERRRVEYS